MAGADSTLGGPDGLLEALILQAAAAPHPLDFLSWHHYTIASGLRYSCTVTELRRLAAGRGLAPELIVSEWSLYPSPIGNPWAIELDGSHCAAQLAGFLANAAAVGLDANCFFMTQDAEPAAWEVLDLTGAGNGSFTRRGVKKPVHRVMELLYPMALEEAVPVRWPANEWAVSVLASAAGNRLRLIVANDVADEQWVWSNACRERGGAPGRLWSAVALLQGLGLPVTFSTLTGVAGLGPGEAAIVLEVLPLAREAREIGRRPRTVRIRCSGSRLPAPFLAWRFDSARNAVAEARPLILPELERVEAEARRAAWRAADAFFDAAGYPLPTRSARASGPAAPRSSPRCSAARPPSRSRAGPSSSRPSRPRAWRGPTTSTACPRRSCAPRARRRRRCGWSGTRSSSRWSRTP
jgi:hypothetical protein